MATLTPDEAEALELTERAKKLPKQWQQFIANALLAEQESEADRAEPKAELTRRWDHLRSGEDTAIPAEQVVADLFRRANEFPQ